MKKLNNNRGTILLVATSILYVLILVSMSFTLANTGEINYARRAYHSSAAFWIAEAGANMYMSNPAMLDDAATKTFQYANGIVAITRDDSRPGFRYVTAVGIYGNMHRKIRLSYPGNVPDVYKNAISTQGNISVNGSKVTAVINGQTSVSGEVSGTSHKADVMFEDIQQKANPHLTSLGYPNPDAAPAFTNFTANNRDVIAGYAKDEVLYIKGSETHTLTAEEVSGKKIIYVEGEINTGDVVINASNLLANNQNLTVIATGTVTFNQNGEQPTGSQLNVIAWGGYNETVSAPSSHRGLIYTHGTANFDNIKDSSVNSGPIIADGGIVLGDIWSTKVFNYADPTVGGLYPPGFERMVGGSSGTNIALKPIAWKEISD